MDAVEQEGFLSRIPFGGCEDKDETVFHLSGRVCR
jgi:hypothetical protein